MVGVDDALGGAIELCIAARPEAEAVIAGQRARRRAARDHLRGNTKTSWLLILVPNVICIAGAFVAGFGVMHSMVFNPIGGLLALGSGLRPLRKAARLRAAEEH
jgi:uncharacterized membrane protein